MPIITPEIGTTYGGLDSAAFADGSAFSSHLLRAMARGANRLISKGHEAFNLVWPTVETAIGDPGALTQYPFEVVCPPFWAPLHPPIPIEKKPGLTSLNLQLTALVLDSWEVQFQVGTLARPFNPAATDFTSHTADGDNDFDQYAITGIPAAPGGYEEVHVWFRGVPDGTLVSTGTVGSPNSSTSSSLVISADEVNLSTATWNAQPVFGGTSTNNLAENGTAVAFLDGNGLEVCAPRLVVDVIATKFWFAPSLSPTELNEARLGQNMELRQLPRLTLANLMGYFDGRTT